MEVKVVTDSRLLKDLSKELIKTLQEKGVTEDILFDIHVSFEEALRNAMVHGNKSDSNKKVTIKTKITEEKIVLCVEDEGAGFDPESIPDPTLGENLMKKDGRGVYLIRHLMDEIKYENGGRKIIMVKYIKNGNL